MTIYEQGVNIWDNMVRLCFHLPNIQKRYLILALCTLVNIICYADRTNIGIVIPALVQEKIDRGYVLSAFFYGYMCTQLIAGNLAGKYGAKIILLLGVAFWTLADISTVVTYHSMVYLLISRICMGLGEAVTFPCLHHITAAWFPVHERSRVVTIMGSGQDVGTILALLTSPVIMKYIGWPYVFTFYSILSGLWLFFFSQFAASAPEHHKSITQDELRYVRKHRPLDEKQDKTPWRTLLTHKSAWAIYISHFCFNYGWYVLLSWIPQYFREVLGLDLASNGLAAACPYICGYTGVLIYGWLSDYLISNGMQTINVRKIMNSIGMFGPAFFLYLMRFANDPTTAVFLLSATMFLGRAVIVGYWVNMVDVGPRYAGNMMGVSNTFATIPGILGNIVTGIILGENGRWDIVFLIAALFFVTGGIIFLIYSTDRNIYNSKSILEKDPNNLTHMNEMSAEELPFLKDGQREF